MSDTRRWYLAGYLSALSEFKDRHPEGLLPLADQILTVLRELDESQEDRWRRTTTTRHDDPQPPMKKGECCDCGVETFDIDEYYMVNHDVWAAANGHTCAALGCFAKPRDTYHLHPRMLCIGCLETRLGRQLCRDDFMPTAGCNFDPAQSPRLAARLRSPNPDAPPD